MKRILFLGTESPKTNGTTQRMLFLARGLARIGVHISVGLPETATNRDFLSSFLPNVPFVPLPVAGAWAELQAKRRVIAEGGYDVVHSFCLGVRYLLSLGRAGRRTQTIIYDWDELLSSHGRSSFGTRLKHQLVEAATLRSGSGFTVASEYLQSYVSSRAVGAPCLLLSNGYDPEVDCSQREGKVASQIRQYPCAHRLVYVGAITRGYQIADLVMLAERIRAERVVWTIFVVGSGSEESQFRTEVERRGLASQIRFMGRVPVDEVAGCLRAADALLFPIADTVQNIARCPLKIFQYLASGVPVVTSPIGEVRRNLEGRACFFRSGDVNDMMAACRRALAQGRPSRTISLEGLTWEARGREYLEWVNGQFA